MINELFTAPKKLEELLPFANEIMNVLSHSAKPGSVLQKLYMHGPLGFMPSFSRALVDSVALAGICMNVASQTEKTHKKDGLLKGIIIIVVAFLAPNYIIGPVMNKSCRYLNKMFAKSPILTCHGFMVFMIGLMLVFFLMVIERLLVHYLIKKKKKD